METLAVHGGKKVRDTAFDKPNRYGAEELAELKEALEQGTLFHWHGQKVKKFQSMLAEMLDVPYCTATSSGTASLHTALGAMGIGIGDEVITSPITDMGTVIGILFQNAIPVFADLDMRTYTLDPASVEEKITERTKAIILVHQAGNPGHLDEILAIGKRHNIYVIEDCAQAWMAQYKGQYVGSLGDMGGFSLNEFKHISAGDGGAVVTRNPELAETARIFADKYADRVTGNREAPYLGPNYRMTELQGAVAVAQLRKVHAICERRTIIGDSINAGIQDLPGMLPPRVPEGGTSVYWHYMFRVDEAALGTTRDQFAAALAAEGIPCQAGYKDKCIYEYPLFTNQSIYPNSPFPLKSMELEIDYTYGAGMCPQAEAVLASSVVIPCKEFYSDQDVQDIIAAIGKVATYYHQHPVGI
ncbi:MAG: spore coat protein [Anaerolineaceae bacterium]|nr:spore coat protein [Anaerolineaceae bacterium]